MFRNTLGARAPAWRVARVVVRRAAVRAADSAQRARWAAVEGRQADFYPPYAAVRRPGYSTVRIPQFIRQFANHLDNGLVTVEGRISAIRRVSRRLYFIDIVQDGARLQVVSSSTTMGLSAEAFEAAHARLCKNDHILAAGHAVRTNAGELSLRADAPLRIVAPCLREPVERLEHRDKVNANRVLSYLVNPRQRDALRVKAAVQTALRQYLTELDFLEVQTPMLAGRGTGANAEPFATVARALGDEPCQLRVAPELWLKKLVIAGFDKVFEIGQSFRNEGIDGTHNPEFVTCEFYKSHTDLPELMQMTEAVLARMLAATAQYHRLDAALAAALERGAFRRVEFVPELEAQVGTPLPPQLTLESLVQYLQAAGVALPPQKSPQSLLDTLASTFLEPLSQGAPIFLYNQPAVMSPLAKSQTRTYGDRSYEISSRFELFINGREYVNLYEEENSPFAQLAKFEAQVRAKTDFDDRELLVPDWEYVRTMEYGLPPTGGWGCGIDRLTMLFSGAQRIEQVLPFGGLKDVMKQ